jgi:asparagine synthase (glutamine-hydrolysing)
MCGFVAILQESSPIDLAMAKRCLSTIAHRGPDAEGVWEEGPVFLGHRRLSIIDLATGQQPMHSSDGRYVVVFNGEIYNFAELRERLIHEGATFQTQSDTEVILEGYRRWGKDVVHLLEGMFAFLVWDRAEKIAFAARDRLGIKPLCWAETPGRLVVASTLEPVLALDEFRRIDLVAVRDLMTFDYIPAPRTVLEGVRKLEPGSRFQWQWEKGSPPLIERYWGPPAADSKSQPPDEFELEELLEAAVRRQMISDVPIGAFLSGGIDSSLVVALMSRHSAHPVRTFSVSFAEGGVDESPIADRVAKRFHTNHTVLPAESVGPEQLLNLLGRLDEPFCDPALIPTFILSEMTKRHVKVALSGDGGDEVFGGYPKYLRGETNGHRTLPLSGALRAMLRVLPWRPRGVGLLYPKVLPSRELFTYAFTVYGDCPVFRKDLRQLLARTCHRAAHIPEFFVPWEQKSRQYGTRWDQDLVMRTDLETYLSENCLVKTDRASMLASLEVRVPFLDEMVLDRIVPLHSSVKIQNGQLKSLLMPLSRRLLPREVWDRPKHGFNVPLDVRLAGAWRPAVETALDWGERHLDLFDYRYLWRLHKINIKERGISGELWNPFVFLAWLMAHASVGWQLGASEPLESAIST